MGGELVLPAAEYARDRRPWLLARRQGLGASDTATVLGLHGWDTPYQLWLEKRRTDQAVDDDANEAAEWGTALESVVARKFSTRHRNLGKIAPSPGLLRHRQHPWMLATVDRLVVPRRLRFAPATALLEVKTTGQWMARHHWIDDAPPPHIQVQVQQQLAVTEMDKAYVVVLVGGQRMPDPFVVERDERVIEQITQYAGQWWQRHVIEGEPPPLTMADDLPSIYPGDAALDPMVASDALLDTYARFLDARRREREAADEKKVLLHQVQTAMGDHTALIDSDDRTLATWKPTSSRRIDVTRLRTEQPDTAAKYITTTTSRRFLPKEPDA